MMSPVGTNPSRNAVDHVSSDPWAVEWWEFIRVQTLELELFRDIRQALLSADAQGDAAKDHGN